jgi:threonine/homoserine/homoserine lactone efflux protein
MALIFLGIFSSSFLIALSGALMPGPLLTYTVAESARRGFWAGPIIMLGHGFLELGLVVLLLLGIGAVINQPVIMGIVGLTGAVILWWLGYGLIQAARNAQLDLTGAESRSVHPFWPEFYESPILPAIWW